MKRGKKGFRMWLVGLATVAVLMMPGKAAAAEMDAGKVLGAPDSAENVIEVRQQFLDGNTDIDLSEQAIYDKMVALKSDYPEGMRWTNDNYYGWKGGVYTGGYGCAGFAFLLSDAAFGNLPARILDEMSYDAIRVGDILRVNNDSHSVVVLQKYETYVVLAEGNYNSSIHWGRTISKSALEGGTLTYIMTRYPNDPIEHHFQVVSRNGNRVSVRCADCGKTKDIVCPDSVDWYVYDGGMYSWSSSMERYGVNVAKGDSVNFMLQAEYGCNDVLISEIADTSIATFSDGSGICRGDSISVYGKKAGTTTINIRSEFGLQASLATIKIVVEGQNDEELTGTVSIMGKAKYGETLTAVLTDGNASGGLNYQWKRGGQDILGATNNSYKLAKEDIGREISCTITCTGMAGSLTGKTEGIVSKADGQGAPVGVSAVATTGMAVKDGKIKGVSEEMEYASREDFSDARACVGTEVTGLAVGTYYVRYKETETALAGTPQKLIVRDGTKEVAYHEMYRLYNPNSGEHFYTENAGERDYLSVVGWNYEGVAWKAPEESSVPVYRLYNPNVGDHHYTPNAAERDYLVQVGWNYEGIGWYSDALESTPLFRLYNPNATTGSHHYTTSAAERDVLVQVGWNDEGIGWYGGK